MAVAAGIFIQVFLVIFPGGVIIFQGPGFYNGRFPVFLPQRGQRGFNEEPRNKLPGIFVL
jgi:hypothetical protein